MGRTASVVWRFFDKIEKGGRCVAVACKLCAREYKFYGNTTNLKTHLVGKHPIQWELTQEGTLEESSLHFGDESFLSEASPRKRKDSSAAYSSKETVDVFDSADVDGEIITDSNDATVTLVREMHDGEEWLEDQFETTHLESYEPKRKKGKLRIKRELQSPTHRYSYITPPVRIEKPDHYVIEETTKKDEFTVFGEYIGNKLRKFKSPHTRGNLQQLITTILWQAEYGMYDTPEAVKRILMYSVHDQPEQSNTVTLDHDTTVHCEEVIVQREE